MEGEPQSELTSSDTMDGRRLLMGRAGYVIRLRQPEGFYLDMPEPELLTDTEYMEAQTREEKLERAKALADIKFRTES